ncbi:MAG: ABC transporter permease, partial [Anaerolineales bacterium]
MKWFDIAFKDLKYTFKNVFSLAMMLGAPLLVTGLLYFAFGGLADGEGDFNLPASQVLVVNLDRGSSQFGNFQAGDMLVTFLEDEKIGDLLEISPIEDERSARASVEQGEADIAVIVPPNFTAAAMTPGERANVSIYHDPALTIAPGILKDLLNHFMDGFSGAKIAANVTVNQLRDHRIIVDESLSRDIVSKYAGWLESSGHNEGQGAGQAIQITSPRGGGESADSGAGMIAPIMAGMLVFFLFFMGANGAQSIIREHEQGTLARLFTTPTNQTQILGGKFTSVFLTITIQAVMLLAVST